MNRFGSGTGPLGTLLALGGTPAWAGGVVAEPVAGRFRLILRHRIGLAERGLSLADGLAQVAQEMGRRLDRPLWQAESDQPNLAEIDRPLSLGVSHAVAIGDPRPRVRLWVAGLGSESLTAAERAASSSPCAPAALYRYQPDSDPRALAEQIRLAQADALVMVGGYDQRDARAVEVALTLGELLCDAVSHLRPEERPVLIYAGNQWVAEGVLTEWQEMTQQPCMAVANVLPAPGQSRQAPLAVALSQIYWAKATSGRQAKRISRWITPPAQFRSLQWGFVQGLRLWQDHQELGSLHGLLVDGSTAMHVWSNPADDGVRIQFVQPHQRLNDPGLWPPLTLVSGPWPDAWPKPANAWHDPDSLLPLITGLAQISPEAALHILEAELGR